MSANTLPRNINNVLPRKDESVPVTELVQVGCCRKLITREIVESLAIEKYRANGKGITIEDLEIKCSVKKSKAQRSLKHFHSTRVLFTAQDLMQQGIDLLQNKNPQEYFATCMKAEILENLKRRKSVPVQPTGVNLPISSLQLNRTPKSPFVLGSSCSACLHLTIYTQITTDVSFR